MTVIHINGQSWTLGSRLDRGGFGEVFGASSGDQHGVIKLVPKAAGAKRELLFADDLRGLPGIVPVSGIGETADAWALLMPRAQHSLRTYLTVTGRLDHEDAFPILVDIADALVRLTKRRVVHRDLKPENILMLGGVWCLSDFGISRYADATTETETRKGLTTRPYNAPEQWREERATSAADVYAWGVICHELLSGARPFNGPDFRDQHLHQQAPSLTSVPPSLAALVHQCLSKAPAARPTPENLARRLAKVVAERPPASTGLSSLRDATRAVAKRQDDELTRESRGRSAKEIRRELALAATQQFDMIRDETLETISAEIDVPVRGVDHRNMLAGGLNQEIALSEYDKELRLGRGCLQITHPGGPFPHREPWNSTHMRPPIDLVVWGHIAVGQASDTRERDYIGRAHSLWYCDAVREGEYGWFETAFVESLYIQDPQASYPEGTSMSFISDFGARYHGQFAPCAQGIDTTSRIGIDNSDAVDAAFRSTPTNFYLAWPFSPLVPGDLSEFIDRWAAWFAQAAQCSLRRPQHFPERDPAGSWRGSPPAKRPGGSSRKRPYSPSVTPTGLSTLILPDPRKVPPPGKKGWMSKLFGG